MQRSDQEVSGFAVPAPLSCRGLRLRPPVPEDMEELYEISIAPEVSTRLRFRGSTPSPTEFAATMFDSVLTQFAVTAAGDELPLGAVVLSSPNFADGHVHMSSFVRADLIRSGIGFASSVLMINYAFVTWPIRKLYLDVPEFNYRPSWNLDGVLLREEGRLVEHSFFQDRYWDLLMMATWRADAAATIGPLVRSWLSEDDDPASA